MSLHHIAKAEPVLEEVSRILNTNGRFICVDRLARDKKLADEFDIIDAREKGIKGGHGHTQRTEREVESLFRRYFRTIKREE